LHNVDDNDLRVNQSVGGFGVPPVLNKAVETPLRDGAAYIETRLRPRRLTIPLFVKGTTFAEVLAARRDVIAAMNPRRGQGILIFAPADQVYEVDAIVESGLGFEPRGGLLLTPQIQMVCHDPAIRVALQNEQTIDPPQGGLSVSISVPLSVVASALSATVTNGGDLDSFPEIQITVERDNTEDPDVENQTTSKAVKVETSFDNGDVITIDMDARTIVDDADVDLMGFRSAASRMWALSPGDNTVEVDVGAGDVSVRFRWFTRLAGV
ncbi:MAG: phage tail family protein, partial [Proteobacteria bacterium]|nr:phage tail family protein [Pseudomonadota bacterium]